MKLSQKERVLRKIKRDGFVTRNECLQTIPAITRLGAIMINLRDDGINYYAHHTEDKKDYIYELISK